MTSERFNSLDEGAKTSCVFEAEKVAEFCDEFVKYSLFQYDGLYLEVATSKERAFKKMIKAYQLEELPLMYSNQVFFQLGTLRK